MVRQSGGQKGVGLKEKKMIGMQQAA